MGIATDRFKISSGRIFGYILYFHGLWAMGITAVLIIAAFALGFWLDLRILIVGFMLLCLVVPMLMAWYYFYYALRPLTAFNVLPHTLTLTHRGIQMQIYAYGEANSDGEPTLQASGNNGKAEEEERIVTRFIPYGDLHSFYLYADQTIYRLGPRGRSGLLILTPKAFPTPTAYDTFLTHLSHAMKRNSSLPLEG